MDATAIKALRRTSRQDSRAEGVVPELPGPGPGDPEAMTFQRLGTASSEEEARAALREQGYELE